MKFTIYAARCTQNSKNTYYPDEREITNAKKLQKVVKNDHVCATYKNFRRGNDNFIRSNVLPMDVDNTHTDNPDEWIPPNKIAELFPNVPYAIAFSRNHMKVKNGEAARPKYHVYFMINEITDFKVYAGLKSAIRAKYSFFDKDALDAARFIYGADTGNVIWHEGEQTIDELIEPIPMERQQESSREPSAVVQGERVNTLISLIGSMIKKGIPSQSIKTAIQATNAHFEPPLTDKELEDQVFPSIDRWSAEGIEKRLIPDDFSDIGQAKAFLKFADIAETTRFNKSLGGFLSYNGIVWLENANIELEGKYKQFTDVQLKMARDKEMQAINERNKEKDRGEESTDTEKSAKRWRSTANQVIRYRSSARIEGTLRAFRSDCLVDISKFDCDPYLLNTPGGVVDLRTGELRKQDPEDYFTKVTNVTPEDTNAELWLDQIRKVCCDDTDLMEYLKMVLGMSLLGAVYQEKLIIIYGGGGNGKSSVFDAVIKVLGDYAGGLSADTLIHTRKNVMPEYAELRGKRFVLARELDDGQRLNSAAVKRLCSTDDIHAEPKYKQPFDFTPSHTIVLYTNHLPKVDSSDAGTWDRLVVVPFNARFRDTPGEIKNYAEVLANKAGGAILKWMIEGAVEFIKDEYKLPTPQAVKDAIEAYKKDNDWLNIFLEECTEPKEDNKLPSSDLYACYSSWANRRGEYVRRANDFKAAMENAGYTYKRDKNGVKVIGIALAVVYM